MWFIAYLLVVYALLFVLPPKIQEFDDGAGYPYQPVKTYIKAVSICICWPLMLVLLLTMVSLFIGLLVCYPIAFGLFWISSKEFRKCGSFVDLFNDNRPEM